MTYGDAAPTVTPSFAGFVLSDNAANSLSTQPTCTTTYTQGSAAGGSYTTSCSGAVSANYDPTYLNGTVTVNRGPDDHGLESHGDLRRCGADGDAEFRRLRAQ